MNSISTCPNCNSPTEKNYCSQCGQPTHLHKETFWYLVQHFAAHYFHFEGKFWVTLKTLLHYPGYLADAYHNKHRMRYVPPMNLYFFCSVIFFIIVSYTVKVGMTVVLVKNDNTYAPFIDSKLALGRYNYKAIEDDRKRYLSMDSVTSDDGKKYKTIDLLRVDSATVREFIDNMDTLKSEDIEKPITGLLQQPLPVSIEDFYVKIFQPYLLFKYMQEHHLYNDFSTPFSAFATEYFHIIPKLLFLLMPILGMLIQWGFARHDMLYVDHVVMSMHTHVFMFVSMACHFILGCFINLSDIGFLLFSAVIIPGLYFLFALKYFYGFSWLRTSFAGLLIWLFYIAFSFVISVVTAIIFFRYV